MDKKSIIGLVLICAVFLIFGLISRPTKEQKQQMQRQQDSIAKQQSIQKTKLPQQTRDSLQEAPNLDTLSLLAQDNDSIRQILDSTVKNQYLNFSSSAIGKEQELVLENEVFKIDLSSKGAIVKQVTLKDYTDFNKKPIKFFTSMGNKYGLNLSLGQRVISTENLYFVPFVNNKLYDGSQSLKVQGKDSIVIGMRLFVNKPDSLSISEKDYYTKNTQYIEFRYTLRAKDYRLGYNIVFNNMQNVITDNSQIEMSWNSDLLLKEKDQKIERQNSSLYYKLDSDVEYLKEQGRDDEKKETGIPIRWICYKQQFFSCALICNDSSSAFESALLKTSTSSTDTTKDYMRTMSSNMTLAYDQSQLCTQYNMDMFFGPNKYNTIKKYKIDLERIIPLGWGFFLMQWINRFIIIPVFDFLMGFGLNFGLIILLLTLGVKIVLFPLAYKSFSSTAKMKVIQPEVNKINEKFPKQDQAMQKQQAIMQLYKRAGINPMSGCLPMLLQFPVLIAMFRFFPSSIELRGQSFLWADDLSTYDSILDMGFNIPFYGNHISLFCLLMTIAQLIYTKMTMNQQAQNNSMPGMKIMMYGMPIFMLFILNNFSAALNYYYLLSLLISVLQMYIIRKTTDEKKILLRLEKNSKKPINKSKWQKRMEALEKRNKQLIAERNKRK